MLLDDPEIQTRIAMENEAPLVASVLLEVLSTTPFLARAIRLYEQSGFQPTTEGPSDLFGTPLFTMVKTLGAPDQDKVYEEPPPVRDLAGG